LFAALEVNRESGTSGLSELNKSLNDAMTLDLLHPARDPAIINLEKREIASGGV